MQRIAAIVVTYNRIKLLKQCIEHLQMQTYPCDILIVNNASTDETEQVVEEMIDRFPNLKYRNTGANIGGAGGFNFGMKWAVQDGYDYLWVMDDDCLPKEDALEKLVEADKILKGNYGWLASAVLWKDGSICKMNIPRKTMFKNVDDFQTPLVEVKMASFVSLFVKTKIVKKYGLPIKEFFIWTDDWEFTRRISINKICYLVNQSIVVHHSSSNIGANVANDSVERIERYRYLYRNDVVLWRREGTKGFIYEFLRLTVHSLKVIFNSSNSKWKRLKCIVLGTWNGLFFRPDVDKFSNK